MQLITYKNVENKVANIQNVPVIVDLDVTELYQVETKRINEAVSRNLATQTTLLIINTFTKVRELGKVIHQVQILSVKKTLYLTRIIEKI